MLVGEIGIDRRTFLRDMRFWEIRRVVRGYGKRMEKTLTNTRMLAYLITSYNGMTDLRKAGTTFTVPTFFRPSLTAWPKER